MLVRLERTIDMSTKTICDGCGKEIAEDGRPLVQVAIGPNSMQGDACGVGCLEKAIDSTRNRVIASVLATPDEWFKAHP